MPEQHLSENRPVTGGDKQPRRVAVIGVHGVAHHDPGETANAMADLLLSLPSFDPAKASTPCKDQEPRRYGPVEAHELEIPLRPVCLEGQRAQPPDKWSSLDKREGSSRLATHLGAKGKEQGTRGSVGRLFSWLLLQDYYGAADSNKYITTRLSTKRVSDSTEVDVYEVFWADLATPDNSTLSFLLALFQFVLHLPSLSRLAIDSKPNPNWLWKVFQVLHRYAARILQMALPMLKLLILIVLASAIPGIKNAELRIVSAIVAGVLAAIAVFLLLTQILKTKFYHRTTWLLWAFALPVGIAGIVLYALKSGCDERLPLLVLSIAIWAVGAALIAVALAAYQNVRPGIKLFGWAAYGAAALTLAYLACVYFHLPGNDQGRWMVLASFRTAQWLLMLLRLSWLAFVVLAILSSLTGAIAWRLLPKHEKAQAKASVRTSRFALALPALMFVLITSFIWSALFKVGRGVANPFFPQTVVGSVPTPDWLKSINDDLDIFPAVENVGRCFVTDEPHVNCPPLERKTPATPDYLKGFIAWSIGPGTYLGMGLGLAGLLVLIWWAIPSVLTERLPARRDLEWYRKNGAEPPRNSSNDQTTEMGAWISRGLDSTALVTWLFWTGLFVVPILFLFHWNTWDYWSFRQYSETATAKIVEWMVIVAGIAAVLAAIVHYSSPALRVILDVDTYLRTGPAEGTPRAKIFERYVSLLRYVADERQRYDRVVIVAHSLGALISGDLLNLLNNKDEEKNEKTGEPVERKVDDPELGRYGFRAGEGTLPIRLFTMGNPVRQLLNRFFPYLYDWVRTEPDNGLQPLGPPAASMPVSVAAPLPDPADVGVEKWVSAYRSGDYVGRSLWLEEVYRRCNGNQSPYETALTKLNDASGTRVEFCIGAGAHTHYWDDTAPEIAQELDGLI